MAQYYLGQILPVAFNVNMIPKGFHLCDGSLLSISQNSALFSLLGVYFGGNGVTTFALPDLRGRAALGANLGSIPLGQPAGTETVTVTVNQLPAHNHMIVATTNPGGGRGGSSPANNILATNTNPGSYLAAPGSNETTLAIGTNIGSAGGSQPHTNMQPYLVVNYMIALQGIYPSRS